MIAAQAQVTQFLFDPSGDLAAQTVESPGLPQIISQPHAQPLIVEAGGLASFSVVLADNTGAAFQWQFDGTNIFDATSDTLDVTNASAANQGQYTVIVDNSFGSVTSAPAMLWYDGNGNGLPDSWEMQYFGNLNQTATGDYDGDGVDNLQEFLDGTNPTNAASVDYRLEVSNDGGVVSIVPNQPNYTNGQTVVLTATPASAFHAWTGPFLSTTNVITVVMTNNMTLLAHFTPVNYVWVSPVGGDWYTGSNWNFGAVPLTNDNAFITNGNFTVTVNTNTDCNNLTLGMIGFAPTITGSATLTMHGTFNWFYGNMTGSGRTVIAPGATMNVGGDQEILSSRTLENAGTVVWSGTDPLTLTSAVITNDAGALFDVQNSETFGGSGSRIDNAGTFRKEYDPGVTTFNIGGPLNNYGTVDVESGTLLFNGAFVNNGLLTVAAGATNLMASGGSSSGGAFNAAVGSLVEWDGPSHIVFTLTNDVTLNGWGLYRINGNAILACNTNIPVQNFDVLSGSTLGGNSTLTVSNEMNCLSGNMSGSGRTVIASGATLNLGTVNLTGWTLENDGTTYWNGTGPTELSSSIITNAPGALFQAQSSEPFTSGGGACEFDNSGMFQKVTNSGTTSFTTGVPFNNYGTVDIQTGTLSVSYGGVNNGAMTLEAGTTFSMPFGTFTSSTGSSITGAGSLTVSGATANLAGLVNLGGTNTCSGGALNLTGTCFCTNNVVNISLGTANFSATGTISPSVLNLTGGTLTGSDQVTVLNSMTWSSTSMSGSGKTLIASGAALNASSTMTLSRPLENAGHAIWTGTGTLDVNGEVITNDSGALFDVQNSYAFARESGTCRFDNAGTFRKSVVNGTASFEGSGNFPLNNYGTVDIETGILSAGGGFTSFPGSFLNCAIGGSGAGTGYGQLQVAGTAALTGGLSVVLTNSYTPTNGASFTLVTATTRSGSFTSFTFPTNQVIMQVSNTTSSVIASVTATNGNGSPDIVGDLPAALLSYAGRTLSLPVTVYGAGPFTFQWEKNGTNVSNTARISGSQTSTLTITNPLATDSAIYQLFVTNTLGSGQSTASAVTVQAVPKLNTNGLGWTLQGTTVPTMNSNNVTLTSGLGNTARSVFYSAPLYVGAFTASFQYRDVGGSGANGITFCLENDMRGASALGSNGSGLGYSGISQSAAFELNINSSSTPGISFQTNGIVPAAYAPATPVNVASGNPIQVSLLYMGNVLQATLVESNTTHTFMTNLAVNLPAIVGGQTAYVGLTGGDGSTASTQVVSNFTFVPLTGVIAQESNPGAITLSWPAVIGGYTAQSVSNLTAAAGVWQNVTNDILQGAGENQVSISPATNAAFYRLSINLSQ
ncbi:MAG TPA: hypothetical protein VME24_11420 [Alphaproteobacteria bacterium]|nr:hypothetical protein [Alphaproteobacteria bacterium]